MLDDHQTTRRDKMRSIEVFEDSLVLLLVFVRRVEKDEVRAAVPRRNSFQASHRFRFYYFDALAHSKRLEIGAHQPRARGMCLDENSLARPAADGLDPDRARARKEINEERILHRRPEDVKERLAQPVAGGPQAQFPRSF